METNERKKELTMAPDDADDDGCCNDSGCCKDDVGCCKKRDPDEPCCKDGCCDEDCCNRTCCRGRINCSLEAGFSAAFAFMSWGATVYACNSCDYIRITGHQYYLTNLGTNSSNVVSGLNRGILYGELVPGTSSCQSWIAINQYKDDLIDIDPVWYTSMACAFAATGFGFAALIQVLFLSCAPRRSQRYVARCSLALSVVTAVCLGLTLMYIAGNAVIDVHFPKDNVDFTTWTMDISAWCAVAGTGGWFITAFILYFQEDPDERDAKKEAERVAEDSEHTSSIPHAQTREIDKSGESTGGGKKLEEDGRGGDLEKQEEVVALVAEQPSEQDEVWEDAVYASSSLLREGHLESQFTLEDRSSEEDSWRQYSLSSSSVAGMGNFVDG